MSGRIATTWHTEGIGLWNAPTSNPCCSQSNAIALLSNYNYVLEIPDDNIGPNQGDDYYIVIRTSNTISDGDDFRLRMDSGSIKYKSFKTVDVNLDTSGANDIAPGSSGSELITGPIIAGVPINLRFNDLTFLGQKVDPLTNAQDAPLEVLGLNLDVASKFPEEEQPGFSDEEISSFVLQFVDKTEATVILEDPANPVKQNSFYLGDTISGEISDNADEDYYVFTTPAGATRARVQVFAENPEALGTQRGC